jgi:hypothetical protein
MATPPTAQQLSPVIDPNNVPETLCLSQFNISVLGPLAVITFTHPRQDITGLFSGQTANVVMSSALES